MINIFPASRAALWPLKGAIWPPCGPLCLIAECWQPSFSPAAHLPIPRRVHKIANCFGIGTSAAHTHTCAAVCVIAIDSFICAHRRSDHFLGKLSPLIFKPSRFLLPAAAWLCDCEKLPLWKFLLWFSAARTWVGPWNHKPEPRPLYFHISARCTFSGHFLVNIKCKLSLVHLTSFLWNLNIMQILQGQFTQAAIKWA